MKAVLLALVTSIRASLRFVVLSHFRRRVVHFNVTGAAANASSPRPLPA